MAVRFTELVAERIAHYHDTGELSVLFDDEVQSEVASILSELEDAAPPQVEQARDLIGTLFHLRFTAVPIASADIADLAYALLFHWLASDPPSVLAVLMPGPRVDRTVQFGAAIAITQHAHANDDEMALRAALLLLEDLVSATAVKDRSYSLRMSLLIHAYLGLLEITGDLRAADEIIELGQKCLAALGRRHPDRSWFLAAVAYGHVARLKAGGLGDVRPAIELGEQALNVRERRLRLRVDRKRQHRDEYGEIFADLAWSYEPPDNRAALIAALADAYDFRYRLALAPDDLDRGIALREQAVNAGWRDPVFFAGICHGYLARFDRAGELPDFWRAADAARHLLTEPEYAPVAMMAQQLTTSFGYPDLPPPRSGRGGFLKRLWLADCYPLLDPDLDVLIGFGELALTATGFTAKLDETPLAPPGDNEDPVRDQFLVRLAAVYGHRFVRLGDDQDIERAVTLAEHTRWIAEPETADYDDLSEVGRLFLLRCAASSSTDDLEAAVVLLEAALNAVGAGDDRGNALVRLADSYRAAYVMTGGQEFLTRALELVEQAPSADLAAAVAADIHRLRFEQSGVVAELDRAIELYEQALSGGGVVMRQNLASLYRQRFGVGGDIADLRRAIELGREVFAESTVAQCVANLAMAYRELGEVAPEEARDGMLGELVAACDKVMTGMARHKATAYQSVASLAVALGQPGIAVRMYDQAVGQLRLAAWRAVDWRDQETSLAQHNLTADAIAAHLAVDDPVGAVEIAEQGRAVLLGSELDTRTDLAGLAEVHPKLAERLSEVRDRLNLAMTVDLVGSLRDDVGRSNRIHLWTEHDDLVGKAREIPGFEGFLRPPRLAELRPDSGAIVLVNAAASRSDAIILTATEQPVVVPLPRLSTADVAAHVKVLLETVPVSSLAEAMRAQRTLGAILGWLWETAVGPILAAIPAGARVWWLPIGSLGLLPLHAAGVTGQPGALDLVVSSYIPTIRALHHARQRPRATVRRQLTVAMAHTPGLADLPGTTAEAAGLNPDQMLLTDSVASPRNVLNALPDCTWAHFACHAGTDPAVSTRAVLHLNGGELPVEAISRLRLEHAELAYLSACSTASRGLRADEPTNLASAFHLAGFRHVVASLWPLNDDVAATAARMFYDQLPDSADNAADKIRTVAQELRTRFPQRPDLWAPLVHSGP